MQATIRPLFCATALLACSLAQGAGLKVMSDEALSNEAGRGGITFVSSLNVGMNYSFAAYDAHDVDAYIRHDNFLTTGTFILTFDIKQDESGQFEYANWQIPHASDVTNTKPLQTGYNLVIDSNGKMLGTHVQYQDIVLAGSSAQMLTGTPDGGGLTYGISADVGVGQMLFSPNGLTNPEGQMVISGVQLGSTTDGAPWAVADLKTQPGTFRVVSDSNGESHLQWGIGWPTGATEAATGRLSIANVAFMDASGVPAVNLGSSSIGSMQIQHLNVRIR